MNSSSFSSEGDVTSRSALTRWLFSPLAGVAARDWASLLRRRGASIPPRYWARTAFTTLMSVINSAVERVEERYRERVNAANVEAPVFIIGHHRSGTTHLWKMLAVNEQFAYPSMTETLFPHTFLTFERMAQALARHFAPQERPQDDVKVSEDAPLGEEWALCTSTLLSPHMARHFPNDREAFKPYLTMREVPPEEQRRWKGALDEFARKLLVRYGTDATPLFKAPHHTARIPLLLDLYPDARFVHIYRNPYRVFKSTVRMEREALPFCTYQELSDDGLEEFILWRYRTLYDAFFEDKERIPDGQLTEVRFEDLIRDRVGTVERLHDDLGLSGFETMRPALERYVASIADYQKNTYSDLSPAKRRRIAEAWRPCFQQWAYPEERAADPTARAAPQGES